MFKNLKTDIKMENKVIVISLNEFSEFLKPILQKLVKLEEFLFISAPKNDTVYSDTEASRFLKISKKKLQNLRNAREIGFIREANGRRVLYKHIHLMEYLQNNELKKRGK